jgi:hypothetical protein
MKLSSSANWLPSHAMGLLSVFGARVSMFDSALAREGFKVDAEAVRTEGAAIVLRPDDYSVVNSKEVR